MFVSYLISGWLLHKLLTLYTILLWYQWDDVYKFNSGSWRDHDGDINKGWSLDYFHGFPSLCILHVWYIRNRKNTTWDLSHVWFFNIQNNSLVVFRYIYVRILLFSHGRWLLSKRILAETNASEGKGRLTLVHWLSTYIYVRMILSHYICSWENIYTIFPLLLFLHWFFFLFIL